MTDTDLREAAIAEPEHDTERRDNCTPCSFRDATDPQTVLALLDRAERAEAVVAAAAGVDDHRTALVALGQYVHHTKPGTDPAYFEMVGALIAGALNTGMPLTKRLAAAVDALTPSAEPFTPDYTMDDVRHDPGCVGTDECPDGCACECHATPERRAMTATDGLREALDAHFPTPNEPGPAWCSCGWRPTPPIQWGSGVWADHREAAVRAALAAAEPAGASSWPSADDEAAVLQFAKVQHADGLWDDSDPCRVCVGQARYWLAALHAHDGTCTCGAPLAQHEREAAGG